MFLSAGSRARSRLVSLWKAVGSGAALILGGLQRIFVSASGQVVINETTSALASLPASPSLGVNLYVTPGGGYSVDAFGSNGNNVFRRADGTVTAPSKLLNNDIIGAVVARGYDGSGVYTLNQAFIRVGVATEDWVGASNHGCAIQMATTANGSGLNNGVSFQIQPSSGVSIGTTAILTDPGAGALLVQTSVTAPFYNATTGTSGYQIAGTTIVGVVSGTTGYTEIFPPDGGQQGILIGANTADAENYYYGSNHVFKDRSAITRATLGMGNPSTLDLIGGSLVNTPFIVGGNTTSSTLTLRTTSGAGATDSMAFQTGSQVTRQTILSNGRIGMGTETNPQQPLVVSANVTTGLAGSAAAPQIRAIGADGANGAMEIVAYTNSAAASTITANFFFATAGGTGASPSQAKATQTLGQFGARGWTSAAAFTASTGIIQFLASEDFTGTASGTYISFGTTPTTTVVRAEAVRIQPSGGVSVGSTAAATDPGLGNLLVQNKIGVGTVVPDSPITINENTAAAVTPPTGTNLNIVGADTVINRITMYSYSSACVLGAYQSGGTQASKTPTSPTQLLLAFGGNGWNGSAYVAAGEMDFIAVDTFSGTASGAYARIKTTPSGTTGSVEMFRAQPSGGVSIGPTAVATDPGLGNLLVQNFINTGGNTRVASDFTVTSSTALVAVTGLLVTLIAGQTYSFMARLYTTGAATGGIQVAMNGTATVTNFTVDMIAYSGGGVYSQGRVTALNTAAINNPAAGSPLVDISGTFTVNASGTFGVTFAQSTSNVTGSVVKRGSWFNVWQVT